MANTSQEGSCAPPSAEDEKAGLAMSNPETSREIDPKWFEPADNQTEYTQGFYAGRIHERTLIIAEIERRICFDALADDDGRCIHHGGKCYDLRQLIKKLGQ
jgi:hypothetical protein